MGRPPVGLEQDRERRSLCLAHVSLLPPLASCPQGYDSKHMFVMRPWVGNRNLAGRSYTRCGPVSPRHHRLQNEIRAKCTNLRGKTKMHLSRHDAQNRPDRRNIPSSPPAADLSNQCGHCLYCGSSKLHRCTTPQEYLCVLRQSNMSAVGKC